MNASILRIGCLAVVMLVGAATANASSIADNGASTLDWDAIRTARTQMQANAAHAQSQAGKPTAQGVGGRTHAGEAFANVDRAYPPSCLQAPMALGLYNNDPYALTGKITLFGDPLSGDSGERNYSELDTVTLFRVVCSGGQSATLLEIDRPAANEGNASRYPTLPGVSVSQGGNSVYVRMSNDPNTFLTAAYSLTPLVHSDVYVLENFYGSNVQFDYNQSFTLTVDNFSLIGNRYTYYPMPAYNPANYAEASLPLPISGYMSTTWTNPNQSGEGLFLQVFDAGDQAHRILAFGWYTYDDLGLPFWLYGQVTFPIGTRTVDVPTAQLQNGSFAPASPVAPADLYTWGTVTLSFPDCGHMDVQYNGDASAVGGPTGFGYETFQRVADVNSLVCQ